ncbi:MAG: CBS domain-containing protein [Candidatus Bathyarchaeia archaeon]|jgi:CBS domain-containing protein
MKLEHILQRPIVAIPSGTTMLDAAKLMVDNNMGLLVICDAKEGTKLVGVISERDIMKAIASGKTLNAAVDEVSTKHVITAKASSDVAEAAKAMNKNRIRHVVVVDEQGKPIGVVSMRDLVGERATLTAILQSNEKEVFIGGD